EPASSSYTTSFKGEDDGNLVTRPGLSVSQIRIEVSDPFMSGPRLKIALAAFWRHAEIGLWGSESRFRPGPDCRPYVFPDLEHSISPDAITATRSTSPDWMACAKTLVSRGPAGAGTWSTSWSRTWML